MYFRSSVGREEVKKIDKVQVAASASARGFSFSVSITLCELILSCAVTFPSGLVSYLGPFLGNGATVARIVPYAALHYMAYEEYRRWIIHSVPGVGKGPILDLIAGSFAGGAAVLFTYPLDLVRTKLAIQVVGSQKLNVQGLATGEQFYKGIRDCFSKTYKEAGIRGLYQRSWKSVTVKLACGSVAGLFGQTFTYPLDVVRWQMQVQRLSSSTSSHEMKGTVDTLVMIVQRHGWKQLYSGLSLNYLKVRQ
ncbi:hypothetical protein RND71_012466 [Anisodus tanguticus]|uniref:Mitochondrial carrier protein n=1 Tax=Anisodus tanguticus TaxID=243964 RepID=A0AAE1SFQ3_9SOLA|nr:hypothetical protein RND71_012466 [Anisodus tanguticus]